jgi:hypothetical protein
VPPPAAGKLSKAVKKVLSKKDKGVEAAKHHGRRKNLKERNVSAAATKQVEATQHTAG